MWFVPNIIGFSQYIKPLKVIHVTLFSYELFETLTSIAISCYILTYREHQGKSPTYLKVEHPLNTMDERRDHLHHAKVGDERSYPHFHLLASLTPLTSLRGTFK